MATITVRNLDDEIKELLRISAAKNGHSMEEEARMILKQALVKKPPRYGLGTRMHQYFAEFGGVELEIPPRDEALIVSSTLMKMMKNDCAGYQRRFGIAATGASLQCIALVR